jgi:molybdenum cofactor guanylyltransferase
MTSKEHHKHSKLARPAYGNYSRNEWAILGSTCAVIQSLASDIINALSSKYKAAYLDATHNETMADQVNNKLVEYTSHPGSDEFVFNRKLNPFRFRQLFAEADYALVNGNHLKARAQVVIIDDAKRASLQKRLADLTDVKLILCSTEGNEVFDFIKAVIPHWRSIPAFHIRDTAEIVSFFEQQLAEKLPVLKGLVLAGGKSERMGHDKTTIHWHGKEQRYHMADLLRPFCREVFISCRAGQREAVSEKYQVLEDSFTGLGPFGAILSAFRSDPDAAWLVLASDLPLLDAKTLAQLHTNRRPAAIATTFEGDDALPEPLITIWEPKSYPLLLANLAEGITCPRKLLINNDTYIIKASNPKALMNVNTPEQAREAKALLETK